jgi:hypothetical protein
LTQSLAKDEICTARKNRSDQFWNFPKVVRKISVRHNYYSPKRCVDSGAKSTAVSRHGLEQYASACCGSNVRRTVGGTVVNDDHLS